MKKLLIISCLYLFMIETISGQEILQTNPKLSDGVVLFPSLTGLSGGAVYVSNKQVLGASLNNTLSTYLAGGHTMVQKYKLGLGATFDYSTINVLQNINLSMQIAKHIDLTQKYRLSLGGNLEYIYNSVDYSKLVLTDLNDEMLSNFHHSNLFTISPSMSISTSKWQFGGTFNRLNRVVTNASSQLGAYYMVFANLFLESADKVHKIEPSLFYYRTIQSDNFLLNAWLYYTYNNSFGLGLTCNSASVLTIAPFVKLNNRWVLGYAYGHLLNANKNAIYGFNNQEIVLRFNLNKQYYNNPKFEEENFPKKTIKYNKN